MNIALFGGAFDPIHKGHIALANYVSGYCDKVLLTPCYKHKYDKKMADNKHRKVMCELAVLDNPSLGIFYYELDNKLEVGTYELFQKIKNDPFYQNYNFSFIIGQDNADTIEKWENWEKLINSVSFIVIPREGGNAKPETNAWYRDSKHLFLDQAKTPSYSSTEIRKLLKEQKDEEVIQMLPNREIYNYIKMEKLYV